jgi:hypothetical protein
VFEIFKVALSQVSVFLKKPAIYFHDGKGKKWSRLDAFLLLVVMSFVALWFFYAMHVVFGSLNPR